MAGQIKERMAATPVAGANKTVKVGQGQSLEQSNSSGCC